MQNLRVLRGSKSQAQVAHELGIPQTTYSNFERGTREPDFKTLVRMADYFGVTLDYLFGRTEKKEAPLQQSATGPLTEKEVSIIERIRGLDEAEMATVEKVLDMQYALKFGTAALDEIKRA